MLGIWAQNIVHHLIKLLYEMIFNINKSEPIITNPDWIYFQLSESVFHLWLWILCLVVNLLHKVLVPVILKIQCQVQLLNYFSRALSRMQFCKTFNPAHNGHLIVRNGTDYRFQSCHPIQFSSHLFKIISTPHYL